MYNYFIMFAGVDVSTYDTDGLNTSMFLLYTAHQKHDLIERWVCHVSVQKTFILTSKQVHCQIACCTVNAIQMGQPIWAVSVPVKK